MNMSLGLEKYEHIIEPGLERIQIHAILSGGEVAGGSRALDQRAARRA